MQYLALDSRRLVFCSIDKISRALVVQVGVLGDLYLYSAKSGNISVRLILDAGGGFGATPGRGIGCTLIGRGGAWQKQSVVVSCFSIHAVGVLDSGVK